MARHTARATRSSDLVTPDELGSARKAKPRRKSEEIQHDPSEITSSHRTRSTEFNRRTRHMRHRARVGIYGAPGCDGKQHRPGAHRNRPQAPIARSRLCRYARWWRHRAAPERLPSSLRRHREGRRGAKGSWQRRCGRRAHRALRGRRQRCGPWTSRPRPPSRGSRRGSTWRRRRRSGGW